MDVKKNIRTLGIYLLLSLLPALLRYFPGLGLAVAANPALAAALAYAPFAGFLILGLLGAVAQAIPYGLGLLVFLPLALISTHVAYRMIFTPEQTPQAELAELP